MSEEKEEFSNQTEEIKKETTETVKKLKESMKNVDIKDETIKTKGFIVEMFKNPLSKMKEIANEDSKYFKTAIFILVVWTLAVFIKTTFSTIYYWGFSRVFENMITVLKNILVPLISVVAYSLIIFVLNKDNKKSLTNIISAVTTTKLPLVIASVVSILTLFSDEFTKITVAFTNLCTILTIVLSYFGYKFLFNATEDKKFIKKFVLIEIIYFVIYIVFTFLGIYIY